LSRLALRNLELQRDATNQRNGRFGSHSPPFRDGLESAVVVIQMMRLVMMTNTGHKFQNEHAQVNSGSGWITTDLWWQDSCMGVWLLANNRRG
jgi:hypothetical protein